MDKILFVGTTDYPIPAIRGGAIQGLVTSLINENEKKYFCQFCIVTASNCEIKNNYKHTTLFVFKKNIFYKMLLFFNKVIRKITNKAVPFYSTYVNYALRVIKNEKPNYVVLETTNNEANQICRKIDNVKTRLLYHVHADYLSKNTEGISMITNKLFSYICVSDYIKKRLCLIDEKIHKKSFILKNSVNLDTSLVCTNERQFVRQKYNISNNTIVFVYCGRLSPEKGCLELIKAFNKIKGPVCLLIIGGENFSSNKLSNYVVELKKEASKGKKRIIFTGYLPNNEIFSYMKACDVGVVPSICNEAASLTIVEFRSVGLATIATNIGGIPEYTNNSCTAFVELNDNFINNLSKEMERMVIDDSLRLKMAINSINDIDRYGYVAYYDRFINMISEFNEVDNNG